MWQLAKALDPTRLIEDMSVVAWDHLEYYGHGDTDVNSWHFYTDNYEKARRQIREVVENTYAGSTFNYVPGFVQAAQPLINSDTVALVRSMEMSIPAGVSNFSRTSFVFMGNSPLISTPNFTMWNGSGTVS